MQNNYVPLSRNRLKVFHENGKDVNLNFSNLKKITHIFAHFKKTYMNLYILLFRKVTKMCIDIFNKRRFPK